MKVCKFGGSSLADSKNFNIVLDTILMDKRRKIIVVSAPGKRFKDDTKVTDLLIKAGKAAYGSDKCKECVDDILGRLTEIAKGTGVKDNTIEAIADAAGADLDSRLKIDDQNKERRLDAIKAFGEEWCARVMEKAFDARSEKARFVDASDAGMSVTTEYGNARQTGGCYKKLAKLAAFDGITVVPGFYGGTSRGTIATFSRGGSDLSGSIIAAAVGAEVYENFSDVPGIFSADPGIIDDPKIIKELTFRELRELAYSGFSVFHDEAIQPLLKLAPDIPIHVRHSDGREGGTLIVRNREVEKGCVVGIAADTNFVSFNIEKHMMNREIGYGRKLLHIIERKGLSYEHTPSSIDSISVIIKLEKEIDKKTKKVNEEIRAKNERIVAELAGEIKTRLKPSPDVVRSERGLAMIAIVGEGMRETVGTAARATASFSEAGVNIEMISQGASEISIVFGVHENRVADAVKSLYNKFFG